MSDLTDIDGIGAAKADRLDEEGYGTLDELAGAEPEDITHIRGVTDNRAMEYIVAAQNLLDAEDEAEEEEFDLTPEDLAEEDDDEDDDEDGAEGDYSVVIEFEAPREFDVFHAAILRHFERVYRGNQQKKEAMSYILSEIDSFDGVSLTLTEEELNELHVAVSQLETDYKGDNLPRLMDDVTAVKRQVDDYREEYLF